MRQREQLGEATLDVSGTFPGEAIRVLILFVAQQMSASTSSRGVFIWPQLTPDEALIMIRTTNTARMRVLVHHLAGALTGTKTHENRRTLP